jgi:circadian clock protein KaiC
LATDAVLTGIAGFDAITHGGLLKRRVTVVLGGPGSGKTIFGLQTLVAGAERGEPGIFVTFEESVEHILANVRQFDWSLEAQRGKAIELFDAQLSAAVLRGGDFDLAGLLAMLGAVAKKVGAQRIVFDGIDVLLAQLSEPGLARREMFRLRDWLHANGMTGIVTAKATAGAPRAGVDSEFLQFLADCVVSLEHALSGGTAVRLLRVAKSRGRAHNANEVSFTIGRRGIDVAGATSIELRHAISSAKVTSGVERLDAMLGGGLYRGTSTLISGAPGTAKSTLAGAFAAAACRRKEPTLYVSLDEAPDQIVRNLASVGIDLATPYSAGVLEIIGLRARSGSPEAHVARIRDAIETHGAKNLVVDPISALCSGMNERMAVDAGLQVLDVAKSKGITLVSTSLLADGASLAEQTPMDISAVADTWLHLSYVSQGGERNRALTVIKSRGTKHSNQVRELILSDTGVTLADVYSVGGEVLMGTLRWEKENAARRLRDEALRLGDFTEKKAHLALAETKARVEALQVELAAREADLRRIESDRNAEVELQAAERSELVARRGGDSAAGQSRRRVGARRR